jgi:hypothetical protein
MLRDTGHAAALGVCTPRFRKIEPPIQKCSSSRTGIGEEDPDLAIVNTTHGAAILTLNACGFIALLGKPSFIDAQDPFRFPKMLDDIGLEVVTDGIGLPRGAAEKILDAVRSRITGSFGELPAVFALQGSNQTTEICDAPLACFSPREVWEKTSGNLCHACIGNRCQRCDGSHDIPQDTYF